MVVAAVVRGSSPVAVLPWHVLVVRSHPKRLALELFSLVLRFTVSVLLLACCSSHTCHLLITWPPAACPASSGAMFFLVFAGLLPVTRTSRHLLVTCL